MYKINYQRNEMTFRCSAELNKMLDEVAHAFDCAKNDILTYCLLQFLDPTGCCADWDILPFNLIEDSQPMKNERYRGERVAQDIIEQIDGTRRGYGRVRGHYPF